MHTGWHNLNRFIRMGYIKQKEKKNLTNATQAILVPNQLSYEVLIYLSFYITFPLHFLYFLYCIFLSLCK